MIFVFDDEASKQTLYIRGELYKYLIKVRRHKEGDEIALRKRENTDVLYNYTISNIDAREVKLELLSSFEKKVQSSRYLHIGWCVIDANSIEKVLSSLCELGVAKITFIYCDRSQKNFKLDFKRFDRIQEASMQQCGRSSYIEFDTMKNVKEFISKYPHTKVFDFSHRVFEDSQGIEDILIGCEGGFSEAEKNLFAELETFRLDTPMVLRSESAVLAVASKILL